MEHRGGEREGLPHRASKLNKINALELARSNRVYQSCALKSSRAERIIER
jgi:hypothetical protein